MSDFKTKCTKFDFSWDSASDPAGGACGAPSDPLAGFKEPTSKGGEGRGEERREGRGEGRTGEGTGRGGERRGREGKGVPLTALSDKYHPGCLRNKVQLLKSMMPLTKSSNFQPKCEQQSSVFLPSIVSQRPAITPNLATERTSVESDFRHAVIKDAERL